MRYLITQTLIGAWNYLYSCREECQEDAYNDFLATLNREGKPTTPEMQNGIDFENEVYKLSLGKERQLHPKWERGINAVATVIKGAPVQVRARRECSLGDIDLLVYGVLDALKAGHIFDVKFSNKGFGSADLPGKYLESPQHPTYFFLVPEATDFTYLVSDGEDLYTETYTRKNTRSFESLAGDFLASLKDMQLLDLYKEKWVSK